MGSNTEEVREKILKTAARMFLAHGCRRITMDDIAGELHISKRTLYTYYSNKEELLEAFLESMTQKMEEQKRQVVANNESPVVLMLSLFVFWGRYNRELMLTLNDMKTLYPDLYSRYFDSKSALRVGELRDALALASRRGELREDVDIEDAVAVLKHFFSKFTTAEMSPATLRLIGEGGYTFLRGLLTVQAIERLDSQDIKSRLKIN